MTIKHLCSSESGHPWNAINVKQSVYSTSHIREKLITQEIKWVIILFKLQSFSNVRIRIHDTIAWKWCVLPRIQPNTGMGCSQTRIIEHVHICYGLSVLHLTDISRCHRKKKEKKEKPSEETHELHELNTRQIYLVHLFYANPCKKVYVCMYILYILYIKVYSFIFLKMKLNISVWYVHSYAPCIYIPNLTNK